MLSKKKQILTQVIMIIALLGMSVFFPNQIMASNLEGALDSEAGAIVSSGSTSASLTKPVPQGDLGRDINLATGVTISLKDLHLTPVESGQVAYVHLEVKNISEQPFDFYPYWLRIQSTVGERFKVRYVEEQGSSKIFPHSSRSFTYYAELPFELSLQDIQIQLIKWDFSSSNYERLIHLFSLPDQLASAAVPVGEKGKIEVQGVPISVEVSQARAIDGALRKSGHFTLSLINEGNRAVKLPVYEYALQGLGFSYPAEVKSKESEVVLLPLVEKKISLTAQMAVETELKDYHLVLSEPKKNEELTFSIPLKSFAFQVPETRLGGVAVGETTTIMYGAHDFDLRIENIHLLPSTALDNMLSYDVYVTNKNNTRVAVPKLASFIHMKNESPELATQKEEEKKELFPDEELKLTMYAAIPDKASLHDLSITFESSLEANPNGEDALEEVYATYHLKSVDIQQGGTRVAKVHHFSDLGEKSTIKPYQTTAYDTNNSRLLVTQLLIENKEQKPIRVPEYRGYYKFGTGAIYPVEYKGRVGEVIGSKGSAIITYWAEVGKGIDIKNVQLVLGLPIDKESEVITEATSFEVVKGILSTRSTAYPLEYSIGHMRITSYLLDEMRNMQTSGEDSEMPHMRLVGSVPLDYNVNKKYAKDVLSDGEERTLTFELVHGSNVLDKREGVKVESDLLSGKNSLSLSANVPMREMSGLRVNVYENFEHGKQLIGTYGIGY